MTKLEQLKAAFEAVDNLAAVDFDEPLSLTNERFYRLAHNLMPQLLEAVELLETASARVSLANDEGNPILSAWLTDANRLLGKLEGHRGELK